MSNAIYKKDLHDVALAVAQGSKNYTDNSIEKLKWELGTYDLSAETINGTTMLLPTPANTIQATMVRVDGKSEVSENLAYIKNRSQTHSNITYVASATEQTLTLNGTSSAGSYQNFEMNIIPSGTYYVSVLLSGNASTACNLYLMDESNVGTAIGRTDAPLTNKQVTFTTNQKYLRINVASADIVFTNLTIRIMVSKTSITEYKKGFEGIHNLELSGLKVEGANLSPLDKVRNNQFFASLGAGTYTFSCKTESTGGGINLRDGGVASSNPVVINISVSSTNPSGTFTLTKRTDLYFNAYGNAWTNYDIMLNRGSTALPYTPYIAPTTLPIDLTSIEDSGGNKLFADGSLKGVGNVADEITPYKTIKRIDSRAYQSGDEEDTSVLTDGTTTLYPLATPMEADIDLSQFVKFEAYSNGSITLVNTNNQDTTSTFKYLKEVAK